MKTMIYGLLSVLITTSCLAASNPYEICTSPLLPRQQQTLCQDQVKAADTIDELKKIQTKFRDRVKAAEEEQKKKK